MKSTPISIWERRHLLRVLVTSNIKRQNKNSKLGYLWWLLDPLLMTGVYFIVVSVIFERGGGNQPFILFLVCGLLPWKAFAESVGHSTNAFRGASGIVKAIAFPKAVLPISLVLANSAYLLFALCVPLTLALIFAPRYGTYPSLYYFLLPLIVLIQATLSLGLCMLLSTAGLFFADLRNIISHVTRMWYFLSPGLYSIDRIPEEWQSVYRLNPMAGLLTSYRDVLMYGRMPLMIDILYPLAFALIVLFAGYFTLRRWEGRLVQHL